MPVSPEVFPVIKETHRAMRKYEFRWGKTTIITYYCYCFTLNKMASVLNSLPYLLVFPVHGPQPSSLCSIPSSPVFGGAASSAHPQALTDWLRALVVKGAIPPLLRHSFILISATCQPDDLEKLRYLTTSFSFSYRKRSDPRNTFSTGGQGLNMSEIAR